MQAYLTEGDIFFNRKGEHFFIHKVLRLEKGVQPIMHVMTRGPLPQRPEASRFGEYPPYEDHHPLKARRRKEVNYLGNCPVASSELTAYLYYLKCNDYDAYLLERGQNPDEIYRKAAKAYNHGVELFESDQFDKAIHFLDKALKLYPTLRIAHLVRGYCHLAMADLEQAWSDLEEAYRHFQEDEDLCRLLINVSLERGMPDLAEEYLMPLFEENANDPELHMYQGYIFLERKDYGTAWDAFRRAQEIDPDNPQSSYNLACYHAVRNEREAAIQWLQIALLKGYDDREYLLFDRHLKSLHHMEDFENLLQQFLA